MPFRASENGDAQRGACAPSARPQLRAQEAQHVRLRDVLGDEALPYPAREDERQLAAFDLLVLTHGVQDRLGIGLETWNVRDPRRQPDRAQVVLEPDRLLSRAVTEVARVPDRAGEADRDALAMHEPRAVVMRERLERMA